VLMGGVDVRRKESGRKHQQRFEQALERAEAIQARGGVLDAPRTSAAPRLARRLTLNLSR
jgi:hypothetical protein